MKRSIISPFFRLWRAHMAAKKGRKTLRQAIIGLQAASQQSPDRAASVAQSLVLEPTASTQTTRSLSGPGGFCLAALTAARSFASIRAESEDGLEG
jgi:hypothetical protein